MNDVPPGLNRLIAIAEGDGTHSLALQADGVPVAWGINNNGETNIPPGFNNLIAIDVGNSFNLALRADGVPITWGYGLPSWGLVYGVSNMVAIAAGNTDKIALSSDGTVTDLNGNPVPAGLANVSAIAAGMSQMIALSSTNPPEFFQHPADETVYQDADVVFVAGVAGRQLSYQWKHDGVVLPGATRSVLLLTQVQPWQAGLYSLVASNAQGGAESSSAALTVLPFQFITQPASQTIGEATNVSFTTAVQGTAPFNYQWKFAGAVLPAATNIILSLTNVDANQAGLYSVVVSNAYGAVESSNALLIVILPGIVTHPTNQTVYGGDNASSLSLHPVCR